MGEHLKREYDIGFSLSTSITISVRDYNIIFNIYLKVLQRDIEMFRVSHAIRVFDKSTTTV